MQKVLLAMQANRLLGHATSSKMSYVSSIALNAVTTLHLIDLDIQALTAIAGHTRRLLTKQAHQLRKVGVNTNRLAEVNEQIQQVASIEAQCKSQPLAT